MVKLVEYQKLNFTELLMKKRERKFTGSFPTMGAVKSKEQELIKELEELKFKEENEELRYTWLKAKDDYLDYSEETH